MSQKRIFLLLILAHLATSAHFVTASSTSSKLQVFGSMVAGSLVTLASTTDSYSDHPPAINNQSNESTNSDSNDLQTPLDLQLLSPTQLPKNPAIAHPTNLQLNSQLNSNHADQRTERTSESMASSQSQSYYCEDSDRPYTNVGNLRAHKKTSKHIKNANKRNKKSNISSIVDTSESEDESMHEQHSNAEQDKQEMIKCEECDAEYTSSFYHNTHEPICQYIDKHICPDATCARKFETQGGLTKHINQKHPKLSALNATCPYCGKPFSEPNHKNKHVENCKKNPENKAIIDTSEDESMHEQHSNADKEKQEMIQCKECKIKFTTSFYKNTHKKICKYIDKHICLICETKFNWKTGLTKHIKSEHKDNTSLKHLCSTCKYCGNWFPDAKYKNQHIKTCKKNPENKAKDLLAKHTRNKHKKKSSLAIRQNILHQSHTIPQKRLTENIASHANLNNPHLPPLNQRIKSHNQQVAHLNANNRSRRSNHHRSISRHVPESPFPHPRLNTASNAPYGNHRAHYAMAAKNKQAMYNTPYLPNQRQGIAPRQIQLPHHHYSQQLTTHMQNVDRHNKLYNLQNDHHSLSANPSSTAYTPSNSVQTNTSHFSSQSRHSQTTASTSIANTMDRDHVGTHHNTTEPQSSIPSGLGAQDPFQSLPAHPSTSPNDTDDLDNFSCIAHDFDTASVVNAPNPTTFPSKNPQHLRHHTDTTSSNTCYLNNPTSQASNQYSHYPNNNQNTSYHTNGQTPGHPNQPNNHPTYDPYSTCNTYASNTQNVSSVENAPPAPTDTGHVNTHASTATNSSHQAQPATTQIAQTKEVMGIANTDSMLNTNIDLSIDNTDQNTTNLPDTNHWNDTSSVASFNMFNSNVNLRNVELESTCNNSINENTTSLFGGIGTWNDTSSVASFNIFKNNLNLGFDDNRSLASYPFRDTTPFAPLLDNGNNANSNSFDNWDNMSCISSIFPNTPLFPFTDYDSQIGHSLPVDESLSMHPDGTKLSPADLATTVESGGFHRDTNQENITEKNNLKSHRSMR